jgi:hypothetical protein
MSPASYLYFKQAIRSANYYWIALSALLSISAYIVRAYRWKYLLQPLGYQIPFWHRYHAIAIGYLINYTIPRAGEVARATMLYRSDGATFSKVAGTILVERAFDVVILASILLGATTFLNDDFSAISQLIKDQIKGGSSDAFTWIGYGFIFLIGIAILFGLSKQRIRSKIVEFFRGILEGVGSVFQTQGKLQFLLQTLLIWVIFLIGFELCFLAFPETSRISLSGVFLAFIAGTIGITLTNGGIGVFPFAVGLSIEYYLNKESQLSTTGVGFALGMIIWCSQTLLVIILGVISLILLPKNYRQHD